MTYDDIDDEPIQPATGKYTLSAMNRQVLDLIIANPDRPQVDCYRDVYKEATTKGASASVSRLLKKPEAKRYLQHRQHRLQEITDITDARVLQEYADVAFAKMTDYMSWNDEGVTIFDSANLTPHQAAAVCEVTQVQTSTATTVKIKLHGKQAALDALAKNLGMNINRTEVAVTGLEKLLEEIAQSKTSTISRIEQKAKQKAVH